MSIDCSILMPELQKINFPFYALIDSTPDEIYVHEVRVDVSKDFYKLMDEIKEILSRNSSRSTEINYINFISFCESMAKVMNVFRDFDHIIDEFKRERSDELCQAQYEDKKETERMYEN